MGFPFVSGSPDPSPSLSLGHYRWGIGISRTQRTHHVLRETSKGQKSCAGTRFLPVPLERLPGFPQSSEPVPPLSQVHSPLFSEPSRTPTKSSTTPPPLHSYGCLFLPGEGTSVPVRRRRGLPDVGSTGWGCSPVYLKSFPPHRPSTDIYVVSLLYILVFLLFSSQLIFWRPIFIPFCI